MMKLVIVILFIILIINFDDIIAGKMQTNNIDFNCIKSLQEELNFDENLHVSVCKYVILRSNPTISDGRSPILINVKILAYSFAIELTLRRKHSPAFTYTSVLLENVDKGEIKHTRSNISAITKSSQLTYYSDTQKNAAMIKFVEKGFATMEGIIGNYVLRYIPRANYYILFRITFQPVPIYNKNLNFYKVVDDVPSYNLKTTIGNVDIKLLVAIDEYSITGRFMSQVIKGLLLHFNAADMLFSKFTYPKITLSIIGIIIPYATRNDIYNRTFDDNGVRNLRTTQIRESNEFFISKRNDYSLNSYHIGVVMTTLPICESESKNCEIYVSGYQSYDCPHRYNAHSKTTIIRHPDFYGNYGAIVQNLKTRFIKYVARRYDEVEEILNPDEAFTAWSENDVDDLTYYFRSGKASCWNEELNVTTRPRNNARSDRKKNIVNGQKWTPRPGVSGVKTNDVSNRTEISTTKLKEERNKEEITSPKDSTLKNVTKENKSRVTGRERDTNHPFQKTDRSKIPSPNIEFTAARTTSEGYNDKGSEVLNNIVTVAPGVKPYDLTKRPQKTTMKLPEKGNNAEILSLNHYVPNHQNQTRNSSTTNSESVNIPVRENDKSNTQTPVPEATKPRFTANDHKIIGFEKVKNTPTVVTKQEPDYLSKRIEESTAQSPKAENKVTIPSPNYSIPKDRKKVTNSTTSGVKQETNLRLRGTDKSTSSSNNSNEKGQNQTMNGSETSQKRYTNRSLRETLQSTTIASSKEFAAKQLTPQKNKTLVTNILNRTSKVEAKIEPHEMSEMLGKLTTPLHGVTNQTEIPRSNGLNKNIRNQTKNASVTTRIPDTNDPSHETVQLTNLASSLESTSGGLRPHKNNTIGTNALNRRSTVESVIRLDEMSKTLKETTTLLSGEKNKPEIPFSNDSNTNMQNQTTNKSVIGRIPDTNHSLRDTLQSKTLASPKKFTSKLLTSQKNYTIGTHVMNGTSTVKSVIKPNEMSETLKGTTTILHGGKNKPKIPFSNESHTNMRKQTTNSSVIGQIPDTHDTSQKTVQLTNLASSPKFDSGRLKPQKNNTISTNALNSTSTVKSVIKPDKKSETLKETTTLLSGEKKKTEIPPLIGLNQNIRNKTNKGSLTGRQPDTNHFLSDNLQSKTLASPTKFTSGLLKPRKNDTIGTYVINRTSTVKSVIKPDKKSQTLKETTTLLHGEKNKPEIPFFKDSNENVRNQTTNSSVTNQIPDTNDPSRETVQVTNLASPTKFTSGLLTPQKNDTIGTNVINGTSTVESVIKSDEMSETPRGTTTLLHGGKNKPKIPISKEANTKMQNQTTNSSVTGRIPDTNDLSRDTVLLTTLALSSESHSEGLRPQKNDTIGTNVLNTTSTVESVIELDNISETMKKTTSLFSGEKNKTEIIPSIGLNQNIRNHTTNSSVAGGIPDTNQSLRDTLQSKTHAAPTKLISELRTHQKDDTIDTPVINRTSTVESVIKHDKNSETMKKTTTLLSGEKNKTKIPPSIGLNHNSRNQTNNGSLTVRKPDTNHLLRYTHQSETLASPTKFPSGLLTPQKNDTIDTNVINGTSAVESVIKPDEMSEQLKDMTTLLHGEKDQSQNRFSNNSNTNMQNQTTNSSLTGRIPDTNDPSRDTIQLTKLASSPESTSGRLRPQKNNTIGTNVVNRTSTVNSVEKPDEMSEQLKEMTILLHKEKVQSQIPSSNNSNTNMQNQTTNSSVTGRIPDNNDLSRDTVLLTTLALSSESHSEGLRPQNNDTIGTNVINGTSTVNSVKKPNEFSETLKESTTLLHGEKNKPEIPSLNDSHKNVQNQTTNNSVTGRIPDINHPSRKTVQLTNLTSSPESPSGGLRPQKNNTIGTNALNTTSTVESVITPDEMPEPLKETTPLLHEKKNKPEIPSFNDLNRNVRNQTMNSSVNGRKPDINDSSRDTVQFTNLASSPKSSSGGLRPQKTNTIGFHVINGTSTVNSVKKPNKFSEKLKETTTLLHGEKNKPEIPSFNDSNRNVRNQTTNSSVTRRIPDINHLSRETVQLTNPASSPDLTSGGLRHQKNNTIGTNVINGTSTVESVIKPDEMSEQLKDMTTLLHGEKNQSQIPFSNDSNTNMRNQTTNSSVTGRIPDIYHPSRETVQLINLASSPASTSGRLRFQKNNTIGTNVINGTSTVESVIKPDEMSEQLKDMTTLLHEEKDQSQIPSSNNSNTNMRNQTTNSSVTGQIPDTNDPSRNTVLLTTLALSSESHSEGLRPQKNDTIGTDVINGTSTVNSVRKPNELSETLKETTTPLHGEKNKPEIPSLNNSKKNVRNQTMNSSVTGRKPDINHPSRDTVKLTNLASSPESTSGRLRPQKHNTIGTNVVNETSTVNSVKKPNEMSEQLKDMTTLLHGEKNQSQIPFSNDSKTNMRNQTTNSSVTGRIPDINHSSRETVQLINLASSLESTSGRLRLQKNNTIGTNVINGTSTVESVIKPDEMSEQLKDMTTLLHGEKDKPEIPSLNDSNKNVGNQTTNSSATGRKPDINHPSRETVQLTNLASSPESTSGRLRGLKNNTIGTNVVNRTPTVNSVKKPNELAETQKETTTLLHGEIDKPEIPSSNDSNTNMRNQTTNSSVTNWISITNDPSRDTVQLTNLASSPESTSGGLRTQKNDTFGTNVINGTSTVHSVIKPDEMSEQLKDMTTLLHGEKDQSQIPFPYDSNTNMRNQTTKSSVTDRIPDINHPSHKTFQLTTLASSPEFTFGGLRTQKNDTIGTNAINGTSTVNSVKKHDLMSEPLKETTPLLHGEKNKPEISSFNDSNRNVRMQTTNSSVTGRKPDTNDSSRDTVQFTTLASSPESTSGGLRTQKNNTIGTNAINGTSTVESVIKPHEMSVQLKETTTLLHGEKDKPEISSLNDSNKNVRNQTTNSSVTGRKPDTNDSSRDTVQFTTLASSPESTSGLLTPQKNDTIGTQVRNGTSTVESVIKPHEMSAQLKETTTLLHGEKDKPEISSLNDSNKNVQNQTTNSSVTGRIPDTNDLSRDTVLLTTLALSSESHFEGLRPQKNDTIGTNVINGTSTVNSTKKPNEVSETLKESTTLLHGEKNKPEIPSLNDLNKNVRNQTTNNSVTGRKPDINHPSRVTIQLTTLASSPEFTSGGLRTQKNDTIGTIAINGTSTVNSVKEHDLMSEPLKETTPLLHGEKNKPEISSLNDSNKNVRNQTTNSSVTGRKPDTNDSSRDTVQFTTLASSPESTSGLLTPQKNDTIGTQVRNGTSTVESVIKPHEMSAQLKETTTLLHGEKDKPEISSLNDSNKNVRNQTTNSSVTGRKPDINHPSRVTIQLTTLASSPEFTSGGLRTQKNDTIGTNAINGTSTVNSVKKHDLMSEPLKETTPLLHGEKNKPEISSSNDSNRNVRMQTTNSSVTGRKPDTNNSSRDTVQFTTLASSPESTSGLLTPQKNDTIGTQVRNGTSTVESVIKPHEMSVQLKETTTLLHGEKDKPEISSLNDSNKNVRNQTTNSSVTGRKPDTNDSSRDSVLLTTLALSSESHFEGLRPQKNDTIGTNVINGTSTVNSTKKPNEVSETLKESTTLLHGEKNKPEIPSLNDLNKNVRNQTTNNSVTGRIPDINYPSRKTVQLTNLTLSPKSTSGGLRTQKNDTIGTHAINGTSTVNSVKKHDLMSEPMKETTPLLHGEKNKPEISSFNDSNRNVRMQTTNSSVTGRKPDTNDSSRDTVQFTTLASSPESTSGLLTPQKNDTIGTQVRTGTSTVESVIKPHEMSAQLKETTTLLHGEKDKPEISSLNDSNKNIRNQTTNSSVTGRKPDINHPSRVTIQLTTLASSPEFTSGGLRTQKNDTIGTNAINGTSTVNSVKKHDLMSEPLKETTPLLHGEKNKPEISSSNDSNRNVRMQTTNSSVTGRKPDTNDSSRDTVQFTTLASSPESTSGLLTPQKNDTIGTQVRNGTSTVESVIKPHEMSVQLKKTTTLLHGEKDKPEISSLNDSNKNVRNQTTNSSVTGRKPDTNDSSRDTVQFTTLASSPESTSGLLTPQKNDTIGTQVRNGTSTVESVIKPHEMSAQLKETTTLLHGEKVKPAISSLNDSNKNVRNQTTNSSVTGRKPYINHPSLETVQLTSLASSPESTSGLLTPQKNYTIGTQVRNGTSTVNFVKKPDEMSEQLKDMTTLLHGEKVKPAISSLNDSNKNVRNQTTNSSVTGRKPDINHPSRVTVQLTNLASSPEFTSGGLRTQKNDTFGTNVINGTSTVHSVIKPDEMSERLKDMTTLLHGEKDQSQIPFPYDSNTNMRNQTTKSSVTDRIPDINHPSHKTFQLTTLASSPEFTSGGLRTQKNDTIGTNAINGTSTVNSVKKHDLMSEPLKETTPLLHGEKNKPEISSFNDSNRNVRMQTTNSSVTGRKPDTNDSSRDTVQFTTLASSPESTSGGLRTQKNDTIGTNAINGTSTVESVIKPHEMSVQLKETTTLLHGEKDKPEISSLNDSNKNVRNQTTNSSVTGRKPDTNDSSRDTVQFTTLASSPESTSGLLTPQKNDTIGTQVRNGTSTVESVIKPHEMSAQLKETTTLLHGEKDKPEISSLNDSNKNVQNQTTNSSVTGRIPDTNDLSRDTVLLTTLALSSESHFEGLRPQKNDTIGTNVINGTSTVNSTKKPNEVSETLKESTTLLHGEKNKPEIPSLNDLNKNVRNQTTNNSVTGRKPDINHPSRVTIQLTTLASSPEFTSGGLRTQKNDTIGTNAINGTSTVNSVKKHDLMSEPLKETTPLLHGEKNKPEISSLNDSNKNVRNQTTNSSVTGRKPDTNDSSRDTVQFTTLASSPESTSGLLTPQKNDTIGTQVRNGTSTVESVIKPHEMSAQLKETTTLLHGEKDKPEISSLNDSNKNVQNQTTNSSVTGRIPDTNDLSRDTVLLTTLALSSESHFEGLRPQKNDTIGTNVINGTSTVNSTKKPNEVSETLKESTTLLHGEKNKPEIPSLNDLNKNVRNQTTNNSVTGRKPDINHPSRVTIQLTTLASSPEFTSGGLRTQKNDTIGTNAINGTSTVNSVKKHDLMSEPLKETTPLLHGEKNKPEISSFNDSNRNVRMQTTNSSVTGRKPDTNDSSRDTVQFTTLASSPESTSGLLTPQKNDTIGTQVRNGTSTVESVIKPHEMSAQLKETTTLLHGEKDKPEISSLNDSNKNVRNQTTNSSVTGRKPDINHPSRVTIQLTTLASSPEFTSGGLRTQKNDTIGTNAINGTSTVNSVKKHDLMSEPLKETTPLLHGEKNKPEISSSNDSNRNVRMQTTNSSETGRKPDTNDSSRDTVQFTTLASSPESTSGLLTPQKNDTIGTQVRNGTSTVESVIKPHEMSVQLKETTTLLHGEKDKPEISSLNDSNKNVRNQTTNSSVTGRKPDTNDSSRDSVLLTTLALSSESHFEGLRPQKNDTIGTNVINGTSTVNSTKKPNEVSETLKESTTLLHGEKNKPEIPSLNDLNKNVRNQTTNNSVTGRIPDINYPSRKTVQLTNLTLSPKSTSGGLRTQKNDTIGTHAINGTSTVNSVKKHDLMSEPMKETTPLLHGEKNKPEISSFNDSNRNVRMQTTNSSVTSRKPDTNDSSRDTVQFTTLASSPESTSGLLTPQKNDTIGTQVRTGTSTVESVIKPHEMSAQLKETTTLLHGEKDKPEISSLNDSNKNIRNQTTNSSVTGRKPDINHPSRVTIQLTTLASSPEFTSGGLRTQKNDTIGTNAINGTSTVNSVKKHDLMSEPLKETTPLLHGEKNKPEISSSNDSNRNVRMQTTNSSVTGRKPDTNDSSRDTVQFTTLASSPESTSGLLTPQKNDTIGTQVRNGTSTVESVIKPHEMSVQLKETTTLLHGEKDKPEISSLNDSNKNVRNQTTNSSVTGRKPDTNDSSRDTVQFTTLASSPESTSGLLTPQKNDTIGTQVRNGTSTVESVIKPHEMSAQLKETTTLLHGEKDKPEISSLNDSNKNVQNQTTTSSVTGRKPYINHPSLETVQLTSLASSPESTSGLLTPQKNYTIGTQVRNGTSTVNFVKKPDEMSEQLKDMTTLLHGEKVKPAISSLNDSNKNVRNQTTNSSVTGRKPDINHPSRVTVQLTNLASSPEFTSGGLRTQKNDTFGTNVINGTSTVNSVIKPDEMSERLKDMTTLLHGEKDQSQIPFPHDSNTNMRNQTTNSSVTGRIPDINHPSRVTVQLTNLASSPEFTSEGLRSQKNDIMGTNAINGTFTVNSVKKHDSMSEPLKETTPLLHGEKNKPEIPSFNDSNRNVRMQTTNSSVTGRKPDTNVSSRDTVQFTTLASSPESTSRRLRPKKNNTIGTNVVNRTSTVNSLKKPNEMTEQLKEMTTLLHGGKDKPAIPSLNNSNTNMQNQTTNSSVTGRKPAINHPSRDTVQLTNLASSPEFTSGGLRTQKNDTIGTNVINGTSTVNFVKKPNELSETLKETTTLLHGEKDKPEISSLNDSNKNVRNLATNSSVTNRLSITNDPSRDTVQLTNLASSPESTSGGLRTQKNNTIGTHVINGTSTVNFVKKRNKFSENLKETKTLLHGEKDKPKIPSLNDSTKNVRNQTTNSSVTGRIPDTNFSLSEINQWSIRASVTESTTALSTANDNEIIDSYKENDTSTVAFGVETNEMSTRPIKSTLLSPQSENSAEEPSSSDLILKDRIVVNKSHVTAREPEPNFSSRNTNDLASHVSVAEFTSPVFANIPTEALVKLTDLPNSDNTSQKQFRLSPDVSNGLESTVHTSPQIESTTDTSKSAAVADTSDSSAFILYASLSVPLLLSIVYSCYLFFNLCRRIRRSR